MDTTSLLKKTSSPTQKLEFNMLPASEHTIHIDNYLHLDDNLDESDKRVHFPKEYTTSENRTPVKIMLTLAVLCTKGSLKVKLNQEEITVSEGGLMFAFPGAILEWVTISPSSRFMFFALNYDIEQGLDRIPSKSDLEIGRQILGNGSYALFNLDQSYTDIIIKLYLTQRELIGFIDEEYLQDANKNFINSLSCVVASWVKKQQTSAPINHNRETKLLASFLSDVHEYATKERSVAFYADRACLSPKYFSRIITQKSGQKPGYWIRNYVILEAKTMLATGNLSIKEVSANLNFPNPSFFCKYFRAATGLTPGDYLKQS